MAQTGTTVQADTSSCAGGLVSGPVLREDSRRHESPRLVTHLPADVPQASCPDLESRSVALVLSHSHPPPGYYKAPTVLRL